MSKKKSNVEIIHYIACPSWMTTFGDCMSLLLCFFVMLMTFSSTHKEKLMEVLGSFQGAIGVVPPISDPSRQTVDKRPDGTEANTQGEVSHGLKEQRTISMESMSPVKLNDMQVINRYNDFRESLTALGFKNVITVQQTQEGIETNMLLNELFPFRKDVLKPGRTKWFGALEGLIGSIGNEVRMEICFSLQDPELAGLSPNNAFELQRKRLDVLFFVLNQRYMIPSSKIAYALKIQPERKHAILRVLLVDRFESFEVPFSDIINNKKKM